MKNFDPHYQPTIVNFRVGQKVLVFNQAGQILFLRRSSKTERAGGWDFPGGGLENEQPEEGIQREALEEANIQITDVQPVATITHDRNEPNSKTLIIGYTAKLKSGEVELSWEHDDFKWLTVGEALEMDLPDGHKKFLRAAITRLTK